MEVCLLFVSVLILLRDQEFVNVKELKTGKVTYTMKKVTTLMLVAISIVLDIQIWVPTLMMTNTLGKSMVAVLKKQTQKIFNNSPLLLKFSEAAVHSTYHQVSFMLMPPQALKLTISL